MLPYIPITPPVFCSVNKIPKNVLTKGWYFNMYFAKGCLRTNERDGCVPESNGWYW